MSYREIRVTHEGTANGWVLRAYVGQFGPTTIEVRASSVLWEENGVPVFKRDGWTISPDPETDFDKSARDLDGFIKWDGCSDWHTAGQHFCGPDEVEAWAHLMREAYRIAGAMMPSADFSNDR